MVWFRRGLVLLLSVLAVAGQCQAETGNSGLETPRATLSTYLTALNEVPPDTKDAARCLDLEEVPALIRDSQGPRLAVQLFGILNRTKYIDLESVPSNPEGADYVIPLRIRMDGAMRDLPPLVLRRGSNGAWRIARETVGAIPETWSAVQGQPVLGDLKDLKPILPVWDAWAATNLPRFWLHKGILEVANWKWAALLSALAIGYLAGVVVRTAAKLLLRLRTGPFGSTLPKAQLDSAGRGIGLFVMGSVFGWFVHSLLLPQEPNAGAMLLSLVLQTVGGTWVAVAAVESLINRLTPRVADSDRAERLFLPILRNLGKVVVGAIAVLFFLQRIGFDVTGLIAGLGIGGVVVALAAKDSVENLFGSFTLIFEMPFQIGDWIIADGIEGTVEEISLRSTTLRTFHDSTLLVPNSKFIASPVENMGRRRYRRMKVTLGITYDATPDQVEHFVKSLREYILGHPKTWNDKIHIVFNNYGPSSLDILLYLFIDAADWGEELVTREEILLEVMRIAERCDVHFAFPTQKMIIDTEKSSASMRILTDE